MALNPSQYSIIDIETGLCSTAAIKSAIDAFKPRPGTKDEEKIELQKIEHETKVREKSALFDAAPITCIGLALDSDHLLFNGMTKKSKLKMGGFRVAECKDEKTMLQEFKAAVDARCGSKTVIAGHAILGFDLPKLRSRYVQHRLKLPYILAPALISGEENQPVCDLMKVFTRYYTSERVKDLFISLEDVARLVGIDVDVKVIPGKDLPELAAKGKVDEVLMHCAVDVMVEEQCWKLFAGLRPPSRIAA